MCLARPTRTALEMSHILEEMEPPIYMVSIGGVYRRDAITATRYPIFHQFEGLAVDEGITLADLKGTLLHVMRALYGPERRGPLPTPLFPPPRPPVGPPRPPGGVRGGGARGRLATARVGQGGGG